MTKMPYGCDLKEYTKEEYEADMKAKLNEFGLYKAVEEILDDMVEENRQFSYAHFSLITKYCRKAPCFSYGDIRRLLIC